MSFFIFLFKIQFRFILWVSKNMTLNEYIIAVGDGHQDDGENFLRDFGSTEVFFSIDTYGIQVEDGPITVSSDVPMRMPFTNLNGQRLVPFFTSKQDFRLRERFAGMPLIRAIEMVCKLADEADGMLIQSDQSAWIAFHQETLSNFNEPSKFQ